MQELHVSKDVVLDIIKNHPNGLNFHDRLMIRQPYPDPTVYDLMILPKQYVSQHPWDEMVLNTPSWFTQSIADIIARSNALSELQELNSQGITFVKSDETEPSYQLQQALALCRQHYGTNLDLETKRVSYIYSWRLPGEHGEYVSIGLLKIDVNYIVVAEWYIN